MTPETMVLEDGSEIVVQHLLVSGRIACMPGLKDLAAQRERPAPIIRTDETTAVTCVVCKRSDAFKQRLAELAAARK